jgi:hypothetical protein
MQRRRIEELASDAMRANERVAVLEAKIIHLTDALKLVTDWMTLHSDRVSELEDDVANLEIDVINLEFWTAPPEFAPDAPAVPAAPTVQLNLPATKAAPDMKMDEYAPPPPA